MVLPTACECGDTAAAGIVAASRYSSASARKPVGRRRLQHPLDQQPVLGEGVDVAAQRPVDERDEHVLLDLLVALLLDQVGADPPVLLRRVEDVVVDPSAVRRLQQRMVEEEAEPAAGRAAPGRLRRSPRRPRGCARTRDRPRRRRTIASANGSAAASARANDDAPPRSAATLTQFHVGSIPTTCDARAAPRAG